MENPKFTLSEKKTKGEFVSESEKYISWSLRGSQLRKYIFGLDYRLPGPRPVWRQRFVNVTENGGTSKNSVKFKKKDT